MGFSENSFQPKRVKITFNIPVLEKSSYAEYVVGL